MKVFLEKEIPTGASLVRMEEIPSYKGDCDYCGRGAFIGREWTDKVILDGKCIGIVHGGSLYGECNYCGAM